MVLARWQATIQDEEGNVLPAASVTVRREATGAPLAALYSDRAGTAPIGNPFAADLDGFAAFHVIGGAYRIDVTSGSLTRTYRYVPIGLAAERDAVDPGIGFLFDSGVNDADPGAGAIRFNNSTPGLATQIFASETDADGVDISAWWATLDDAGDALNRGTFVLQGSGGSTKVIARVTGSITDGGAYVKIPITIISATAAGTFVQGARTGVSFTSNGTDGEDGEDGAGSGDVLGPGNTSPGIAVGELAAFASTDGKHIDGTGRTIDTVGAGKQSVWIPAGAMTRQTTNPPSTLSTDEMATNDVMRSYLQFDSSTAENAQFSFPAPKGMDEAAGVTFRAYWSHPAAVTNFGVAWQLQGLGLGNDDAMDAAFATGITVTDTGGTTADLYITDESVPVTIASVAEGDLCVFRISRQPGNASDTLAVDAYLLGVMVFYMTNRNTDD